MSRHERDGSHATRLSKSICHTIRIDALRVFSERTASPSELARALGENVSHVSYHVSELRDYGCIELVREEQRRGAVEHFYRVAPAFFVDRSDLQGLSLPVREGHSATILQSIFNESVGALRLGSLDSRPDRHLSWMPMDLDEEGWREATALLALTLKEAEAIKARNAERLERSGKGGVSTIVSMMAFERSRSCCE